MDASSRLPRTMLITGATGFIGSRLADLALAKGYKVKTLTRSDWDSFPPVPVTQRYFGNLPDEIPLAALKDVDVVVHTAASIEADEQRATAVNVKGTLRLAQLSQQAGNQNFIFLSSQSARPDALSAYGKTKYLAEQALLQLEVPNVIVLRPGLVTGAGSRGLFQRLGRTVESLPIVPLLGGKSIVQPIHVDDLCAAIFQCDESAAALQGRILNLGHPTGITLEEFLQTISVARLGRRKLLLPVPIWPVALAVNLAERIGIPLPLNSGNIKGMQIVERMETKADLASLNLSLRSVDEMVRNGVSLVSDSIPLTQRPVRVILIGGGRIGLVHALTLSRLRGVVLSGIVDPNPKANALLKGMGLSAPVFSSLGEALEQIKPDAGVIATPPIAHLELARKCLENGLAVLVEKPLALTREQLDDYQRLAEEFPSRSVQVGYVMTRNPQVMGLIENLRAGYFGNVTGFVGITLSSLIQEANAERWEVKKKSAGGGALINAGGHVLSMIHEAFGKPLKIDGQTLKLYSSEVEDSVALEFEYSGFRGRHYCSWSIDGYPRQENRLVVQTEQGQLVLTASVGLFISNKGDVDIHHQLDFDVGFNLAPDYAGAGFTNELNDLKCSVLGKRPASMDLDKAIELEKILFSGYENCRETKQFTGLRATECPVFPPPQKLRLSREQATSEVKVDIRRVLDLRDVPDEDVTAFLESPIRKSHWNEYLILPSQYASLKRQSIPDERLRVTVPDFFRQSRLLSAGHFSTVLKEMGVGGVALGTRVVLPTLIRERAPNFWVAATGLVGAALQPLPTDFKGTILLHVYITDLAFALRRFDVLETILASCRRFRPQARVGFHTNMLSEAGHALQRMNVPVEEVSALSSPGALNASELFAALRCSGRSDNEVQLTAEIGLAPDIVHKIAFDAPAAWLHGADALLIGPAADILLDEQRRGRLEQAWLKVFPGLTVPEGCL